MTKKVNVVMTRTADVFIPLAERAAISNRAGAKIFNSIHLNAFNGKARGTETFLHTNSTASQPLADAINRNMINELGLPNRGVKKANLAVLRGTYQQSFAVLTEPRFIDNAEDAAIIKSPDFINKMAKAHADACLQFLSDGDTICIDPGHGGHDPGATGYGLKEKDIVLQIALKTRELLLGHAVQKKSVDALIMYEGKQVDGFIEDGTSYAQMRALADLLGVPVNWDQTSKQAYLAGEPVNGVIIAGRTYLPVRSLANMLGLSISYDNRTKTVNLR